MEEREGEEGGKRGRSRRVAWREGEKGKRKRRGRTGRGREEEPVLPLRTVNKK